jgi:hypothetical protein
MTSLIARDENYAHELARKLPEETLVALEESYASTMATHAKSTQDNHTEDVQTFSSHTYQLVMLQRGLPYVGFGFMDNAIMIIAGDYIDHTFGLAFGVSTMFAAGLGNTVSDVMGVGTSGWVESVAERMGKLFVYCSSSYTYAYDCL